MTKTNASKELVDKIVKIYQAKEVREKDVKEIKDLIDRGANVNTYINEYGTTLLHCAVFKDISPSRLTEKVVKMIINPPKYLATLSIAIPASLDAKIPIAINAEIIAPVSAETPTKTFRPKPAPAILPILKANPPKTIKKATT